MGKNYGQKLCDALDGFEWLRFRNRAMVLASRLNPRFTDGMSRLVLDTDGMSRLVLDDEIHVVTQIGTLSEKSRTKLGTSDVGSCSPNFEWTKCEVQY